MEATVKYLYCYECSLQFDKKSVLDAHLSVVHVKTLGKKQVSDSQPLVVLEPKELKNNHLDVKNNWKMIQKEEKSRHHHTMKEKNNSNVMFVILSLGKKHI